MNAIFKLIYCLTYTGDSCALRSNRAWLFRVASFKTNFKFVLVSYYCVQLFVFYVSFIRVIVLFFSILEFCLIVLYGNFPAFFFIYI